MPKFEEVVVANTESVLDVVIPDAATPVKRTFVEVDDVINDGSSKVLKTVKIEKDRSNKT